MADKVAEFIIPITDVCHTDTSRSEAEGILSDMQIIGRYVSCMHTRTNI